MLQAKGQTVGYIRVSSVMQHTDRQLADLSLDKVFEDKVSGKDQERPALKAMLDYIREGDCVYVHSLDRLARNLTDLLDLVEKINAKGCSLHFLKEHMIFENNKSDPTSKLLLSVMGAVAEFERSLIRERQREGIAIAKAQGKLHSGRKEKLNQEQIKEAVKLKTAGVPLAKIAVKFGVSRPTLYRALKAYNVNKI
ncbi:recombinase family protein [Succinatimonas hippei]|uniref:recombinase family protein n=1 Tax=Succinatimonas hippei TaxID=626938 RepID=UPI00248F6261|nr:recombinase family protein [Succinatimonas hippei]